jgi:hypothetical protein
LKIGLSHPLSSGLLSLDGASFRKMYSAAYKIGILSYLRLMMIEKEVFNYWFSTCLVIFLMLPLATFYRI